jgi:MEMO1 family protein
MDVLGCACPHPPLLVPEIGGAGRQRVRATVDAMAALGKETGTPDLVVIVSPHTPGAIDTFLIKTPPRLAGDLSRFGAPDVRLEYENDLAFVDRLLELAGREGVALDPVDDDSLDHGILVPMGFIESPRLVSISVVGPYAAHRRLGALVRQCADELGGRVVFVASGDLSHRLTIDGPYRFDPRGPLFDERVVELLRSGDFDGLDGIDPDVVQGAGECGLRSLVALGAFLGEDATRDPRVFSYEGPFGVGYMVAGFGRGRAA